MKKKSACDYLPENWRDTAWSLARAGASSVEILESLVGNNSQIWHRLRQDPVVREHLQCCREVAEAWWLRHGQQVLLNPMKSYNVQMYMIQMRLRFGYTFGNTDQQVTVGSNDHGKINVHISVVQPDGSSGVNGDK